MQHYARAGLALGFVFALGCGSTETTAEPQGGGGAGGGGASEGGAPGQGGAGGATGGAGGAGGDAAEELMAPTLDELMKMGGALHVMWTNNQVCDFVLIERKDDVTDWAQILSVKGTYDNKMDGTATEDMDYTYRLRCEVGDATSAYSNELTRNPTQ